MTIEDPVEFVYTPVKYYFSRELHADTHSWCGAQISLEEDPNVVLVGRRDWND